MHDRIDLRNNEIEVWKDEISHCKYKQELIEREIKNRNKEMKKLKVKCKEKE